MLFPRKALTMGSQRLYKSIRISNLSLFREVFLHIIFKESKVWKLQKFCCYFRFLRVFEPIKHYRDGLAW